MNEKAQLFVIYIYFESIDDRYAHINVSTNVSSEIGCLCLTFGPCRLQPLSDIEEVDNLGHGTGKNMEFQIGEWIMKTPFC